MPNMEDPLATLPYPTVTSLIGIYADAGRMQSASRIKEISAMRLYILAPPEPADCSEQEEYKENFNVVR